MIIGIIYKYTSPSGKSYIGQTTNEEYRRRMWFGTGRYTGGRSKIIQYSKLGEYNKTWDNIDIVAKTLQVSRESIAGCCRGECKSIKNFKWKYKEE
nr:MAG TPA: intron associated endonuclease [Crassvirales sp.]